MHDKDESKRINIATAIIDAKFSAETDKVAATTKLTKRMKGWPNEVSKLIHYRLIVFSSYECAKTTWRIESHYCH